MSSASDTLSQRRIIVGVTGGIAAYKCVELVRLLKKAGAQVHVVMTPAALSFVGALTFQAVSGEPVHTSLLDENAEAGMGHIALAKWAQDIIIAPASANTLAKLAQGLADNLLTTLCLATDASIYVAPAMNQAMWKHPAMRAQMHTLQSYGYTILGPGEGAQACGDTGPGRMLEPSEIMQHYIELIMPSQMLKGLKFVVTAGPTREAIDPVRYLSNHSSGKMGFALATAAKRMGAQVVLISGPTQLDAPNVEMCYVNSAQDMMQAADLHTFDADVFISAAAVADYRPKNIADQKMKKTDDTDTLTITLVKNPDILATVSQRAHHQASQTGNRKLFTVGFAAETQAVEKYAKGKLLAKQLDMIIANDVSRKDIGFNQDDNEVLIITPHTQHLLHKNSKYLLSIQILSIIHQQLGNSLHAVNTSQDSK